MPSLSITGPLDFLLSVNAWRRSETLRYVLEISDAGSHSWNQSVAADDIRTNEHSVRPRKAQPLKLGLEGQATGLGLRCTPLTRRPIGRLLSI